MTLPTLSDDELRHALRRWPVEVVDYLCAHRDDPDQAAVIEGLLGG